MAGLYGAFAPIEGNKQDDVSGTVNSVSYIKVRESSASDADLHAANLTDWQQEYDQISRGSFHGTIVELPLGDLQVFREHTSQALQQRCEVWPDSVWLGIPFANQAECLINGLQVSSNIIMCRPGSCEFQLSTPQDYDLYGLVVHRKSLTEMARIHGVELNWREFEDYGRLEVPSTTLQQLRIVLARLLDEPGKKMAQRMCRDIVMMALLEVLQVETPKPIVKWGYHHRKNVVDKACFYIDHNLDEPITITELCQVVNVSRRTLQYSFERILGVSPIQYLRTSRLNGVRRALVKAAPQTNVADVAADWGFWHMSQFAKDYRTLFGELPSQTLARGY